MKIIGPSLFIRVASIGAIALAAAMVVGAASQGEPAAIAIPGVILLGVLFLSWKAWQLGVFVDGDQVVVQRPFKKWTFGVDEVEIVKDVTSRAALQFGGRYSPGRRVVDGIEDLDGTPGSNALVITKRGKSVNHGVVATCCFGMSPAKLKESIDDLNAAIGKAQVATADA